MARIKVLLVDDDPINNFIIKSKFVIDKSIELIIYEDPEKALDFLKNNTNSGLDIILLDINMPVIDGWGFLTELDKMNKTYKVIFITSSIVVEHEKKARKNKQVVDYFIKPLEMDDFDRLISKIKSMLS